MPRSDDYAAGYRAGVEAAAARYRLLATDMRGFSPWRHYDYVQRQRPRARGFYAIAAAIAPLYDNIASEIEKLLKEPANPPAPLIRAFDEDRPNKRDTRGTIHE